MSSYRGGEKGEMDAKKSCESKPALESFLDVLKEGAFADVTFIVGRGKERIPSHQLFLRARSPVFRVMFSERWNEDTNKEVPLEDVEPKIFKKFLQYIYADILEVNVAEALELLQVAHKYDVQLLMGKCEKVLESEVTLEDAVEVFQAAHKYERTQLMDKVGDLVTKAMFKFQSHQYFSLVDKQFFMYLLKRNDLKMSEVDVFRLAVRWATTQAGTMEETLEDILPLIRFPTMTPNEFTTAVVPTGLLSQAQVIELFTYFGSDAETKKSMASTLKFNTERRKWTDSSIALYATTFRDCKFKRERYKQLYDRLECDIYNLHGGYGMFSSLYALLTSQPETKSLALSSITLYCPARGKCGEWEHDSNATKTFKVVVAAKGYYDSNFKEVRVFPKITTQEGKMNAVQFCVQVPLDRKKRYCIIVEEAESSLTAPARGYEVRDFGNMQRRVTTALGESWAYLRNIHNYRSYNSLGDYHTTAQLIYKLGVTEVQ